MMLRTNMTLDLVFQQRFKEFGATPKGSFWLSKTRQNNRFAIICEQVKENVRNLPTSIADIGCGYGALVPYLKENDSLLCERYYGVDICSDLIAYCKAHWEDYDHRFNIGVGPAYPVDVTVMSGTYNLSITKRVSVWEDYIFKCFEICWSMTEIAMIFNLQVEAKARISRSHIYYANAANILEKCVQRFGPTRIIRTKDLQKDATFVVLRNN